MTLAIVGATAAENSASGSTIAATRTLTAGNSLIVFFTLDNFGSGYSYSCSDDKSDSFGSILESISDTGDNQFLGMFFAQNVAGGSTVVTVNFGKTSNGFRGIVLVEVSGALTSGAQGGHAGQYQTGPTGTDSISSTSITPSAQPGILVAFSGSAQGGSSTPTAGTGFTSQGTYLSSASIAAAGRLEYKLLFATSALAATFTPGSTTFRHFTIGAIVLGPSVGMPLGYPQRAMINAHLATK